MDDFIFPREIALHQVDGVYADWSKHVTLHCLPFLQQPPSSDTNDFVLRQLRSYYEALDRYANPETILYFLFPSWRSNSLESPILFLGDVDPYLFTSLIRSFVVRTDQDLDAWTDESSDLGHMTIQIDGIESRIKEAISGLLNRMRNVQNLYVDGFLDNWVARFHSHQGRQSITVMETAASMTVDDAARERVRIFAEANALRTTAITQIVEALSVHQTALFLEGLCEFLAGFKHQGQAFQNSLFPNQPAHVLPQLAPRRPTFSHSIQEHTYEPPLKDIFVGDLTYDVTAELLRDYFKARYSSVRRAKIAIHEDSGRSKLYGFVSFADENERLRAITDMDGARLTTRRMRVRQADM